jgi:hypothetical protein
VQHNDVAILLFEAARRALQREPAKTLIAFRAQMDPEDPILLQTRTTQNQDKLVGISRLEPGEESAFVHGNWGAAV